MTIAKEQIESVTVAIASGDMLDSCDTEEIKRLALIGLAVSESKVTPEDLGHAVDVCDDVKRFDGNSDRQSEKKRARTIKMLRALAEALR